MGCDLSFYRADPSKPRGERTEESFIGLHERWSGLAEFSVLEPETSFFLVTSTWGGHDDDGIWLTRPTDFDAWRRQLVGKMEDNREIFLRILDVLEKDPGLWFYFGH